jgi:hypothetical protein
VKREEPDHDGLAAGQQEEQEEEGGPPTKKIKTEDGSAAPAGVLLGTPALAHACHLVFDAANARHTCLLLVCGLQ